MATSSVSSSCSCRLHQLELVARILLLEVEHDAPARIDGDQLEQQLLHRLHRVERAIGRVEARHEPRRQLEELHRHLLAVVRLFLRLAVGRLLA